MSTNKLDVLNLINPQMRQVLAKQAELAGDFDVNVDYPTMRARYTEERRFWNEGAPEVHQVEDRLIETRHGQVKTRFYQPQAQDVPVIIYIHGGGFVVGNCDTHDRICRLLSTKTGAAVVSIDYSLSPEAVYPQALEECVDVTLHLREQGASYGIDPQRISFAGDSGGANLALGSYLKLRDDLENVTWVKTLLCFYGWFGLLDSPSFRTLGGSWDGLTESDVQYYLQTYLANTKPQDAPYFDCFRKDLTQNMPATYLASAEFDPLKDDSTLLESLLKRGGIPVQHDQFQGVIHAFLHFTKMLDEANQAMDNAVAFYLAHSNN